MGRKSQPNHSILYSVHQNLRWFKANLQVPLDQDVKNTMTVFSVGSVKGEGQTMTMDYANDKKKR